MRFLLPFLGALWAHSATDLWFAPDGTGRGNSRESPARYSAELIKRQLADGRSANHELVIHFLPGVYVVSPIGPISGRPSPWRLTILGEGQRPEDTVLRLVADHQGGQSDGGGNSACIIDLRRNEEYLRRFVIENITLDSNWEGQTGFNHRGYLRAYKTSPLSVSARTGRFRKVIVRNFGAHGMVPHRSIDVGAGVEAFPITVWTRDEGQLPEDGDLRPWVVEDCEVSDFHGLYNGYTTCLIAVVRSNDANTPRWAIEDVSRRLIWFRRNQVRGSSLDGRVIGLGAAGLGTNYTSKITFSDNVILNGAGFNTDTGSLRHLDLTNNLFLDTFAIGYLGTAFTGTPTMIDYDITRNSIRLTGRGTAAAYTDFGRTNNPKGGLGVQFDPSLKLGRRSAPPVVGLSVAGIAQDITLSGNWFTSRAEEAFAGGEPGFQIVYRVPARSADTPNSLTVVRQDALDVDLTDNRLSSVPFDFMDLKPLEGGRLKQLGERSSPLLNVRRPASPRGNFRPTGVVERVGMILGNRPMQIKWSGVAPGDTQNLQQVVTNVVDRVLVGGLEVVCGTPTIEVGGTKVTVPVRVVIQPTPLADAPGTRPVANRSVHLEILPGSQHPRTLSAVTDREGIATFSYEVAPGTQGMDFYRAWTDFGQGAKDTWDEFQDAWATAELALGNTVGLEVIGDIADARNGNPAIINLVRKGQLDRPLVVNLTLAGGQHAADLGQDFELTGPAFTGKKAEKSGNEFRVTIPARTASREIHVKPVSKTARSGRVVTLQVQPGEQYGVGSPASGQVAIFAPGK